jgi:hypothetical protein
MEVVGLKRRLKYVCQANMSTQRDNTILQAQRTVTGCLITSRLVRIGTDLHGSVRFSSVRDSVVRKVWGSGVQLSMFDLTHDVMTLSN